MRHKLQAQAPLNVNEVCSTGAPFAAALLSAELGAELGLFVRVIVEVPQSFELVRASFVKGSTFIYQLFILLISFMHILA